LADALLQDEETSINVSSCVMVGTKLLSRNPMAGTQIGGAIVILELYFGEVKNAQWYSR
jgi:hypothetical protein